MRPDATEPARWDAHRVIGVGTTVNVEDIDGRAVTVVARTDGRCDLFVERSRSVTLAEPTTRALGSLLAGGPMIEPGLLQRLDGVLGGLTLGSVPLEPGSPLAGRSIEELAVRRRTGVTVVAILRGQLPIVAPEPGELLESGDDLVVLGRPADVERHRHLLGELDGGT